VYGKSRHSIYEPYTAMLSEKIDSQTEKRLVDMLPPELYTTKYLYYVYEGAGSCANMHRNVAL